MSDKPVVKFVDLPAQFADIESKIVAAVTDIIHRGAFVGGPALTGFEEKLAAFCGTKFAVGCSDGTMALHLALLGMGLQKGDGVVVPTNSFIASANAVAHAGGRPVLVDCDPETYLLDLAQTEDALKAGKAKFILPVHLYGNPCPMKEILALADKYGAKVLEDNAQAIGATLDGKRTGNFGAAAGISFYPAKNLGAFGQGGAMVTNDENVAKTVRMYGEQGQGAARYYHDVVGFNSRLDSLQAAILNLLLDRIDAFNAARLQAADWYAARLPKDRIQKRTPGSKPVYHLFEYRCDSKAQRDKLVDAAKVENIQVAFHYPVPIHKQKAYPECNHQSLPVAERLAETLISLPMHPGLTEAEVDRVCKMVLAV
jgi:dTDP-4-amino-4,6-dideoxygalactose transaminase